MSARWLCLLALLCLVVLSGCGGGGGTPEVIAGLFFPLPIGTVWTYSTLLQAETGSDSFSTTGTFTRTLLGTQNITVNGAVVNTFVFEHVYTTGAVPALLGGASIQVRQLIRYCFSDPGGLQSLRAYYRQIAATPDMPAHIRLVALSYDGGTNILPVPLPQPYFLEPPYHGHAQNAGMWFMPMPLQPRLTEMTDLVVNDKVLNYALVDVDPVTKEQAVISIHYHRAQVNMGTATGAMAGRGRTLYTDTIGLWGDGVPDAGTLTEWYATFDVGGETGRVSSYINFESML